MGRLLNIYEAAEASGLSERQLRRKLASLEGVPGARKDVRGRWLIPGESAANLRKLPPRLTDEEKSLALDLKAEDRKITAKEVAGKINRLRMQRGEERTSKDAVEKFLRKAGGTGEQEGQHRKLVADPTLLALLEQTRNPEFVSALLEGQSPSDSLDLRGLPEDVQEDVRELFRFAAGVVKDLPGAHAAELPGVPHTHLTAAEQEVLESQMAHFAEGIKQGLERGLPLGFNHVAERMRQEEANREAVQQAVDDAVKAVDELTSADRSSNEGG